MEAYNFISEIEKTLNKIRPAMEADGGGINVSNYDENKKILYIKFKGACINCPSQKMTFNFGIQKLLKEEFPWLASVQIVKEQQVTQLGDNRQSV